MQWNLQGQNCKVSQGKKVTEEFNKWMNKKVSYQKQSVMWSYALLLKNREIAQYFVEKKKNIDFSKPKYAVKRQDSLQVKIVKCLKKRLFKDSRSPSVRALSYGWQPQMLYF